MGFKSECTPLPDTTFEWGRTDCPTAPKQLQAFEFPTVDMTRDQMLDFFTREFGFNAQEVHFRNQIWNIFLKNAAVGGIFLVNGSSRIKNPMPVFMIF